MPPQVARLNSQPKVRSEFTKMRMVVLQPSESDPHLLLIRRKSPRFRYWLEPFLESPGEAKGTPEESTRTPVEDELLPDVPPMIVPVLVVPPDDLIPVEDRPPELALPPLALLEAPPLAPPAALLEPPPLEPPLALPPAPAWPPELALALAPPWLPPLADFPPPLPVLALLPSAPALPEDPAALLAPPPPPALAGLLEPACPALLLAPAEPPAPSDEDGLQAASKDPHAITRAKREIMDNSLPARGGRGDNRKPVKEQSGLCPV